MGHSIWSLREKIEKGGHIMYWRQGEAAVQADFRIIGPYHKSTTEPYRVHSLAIWTISEPPGDKNSSFGNSPENAQFLSSWQR
jgi:hypothetical protein